MSKLRGFRSSVAWKLNNSGRRRQMNNKKIRSVLKNSVLVVAISFASSGYAVDFNLGEVQGRFDSQLSVGANWGTSKPDSKLIDQNNGGTGASSTGDDGRLNFERGETYSKIVKGVHDLELTYADSGAF